MDERLVPALAVLALLVIAFVFMFLGWRNRRRRQAHLDVVPVPPTEIGEELAREKVLYVATTIAEQPLERVVVEGLAYRAKGEVRVARNGVVMDLRGSQPAFIPTADIRGVGLASWTIDHGVEDGGLVFVRWQLGDTAVDTYLRADRSQELLEALTELSPAAAAAAKAETAAPTTSTPDGEASA